MSHDVNETLNEREEAYGPFKVHSDISQSLKEVMIGSAAWCRLTNAQRESLEMIQHKIARILNRGANCPDNWHDIAGYATLIERELS